MLLNSRFLDSTKFLTKIIAYELYISELTMEEVDNLEVEVFLVDVALAVLA
jgi:hypothetical protein